MRRKEAISWKTHFLGVANVVKVIWFRFRISVARELPSSTRPGFAPTLLACTTSKSVTAISSSTNLLAMGRSTHIAVDASKFAIWHPRAIAHCSYNLCQCRVSTDVCSIAVTHVLVERRGKRRSVSFASCFM